MISGFARPRLPKIVTWFFCALALALAGGIVLQPATAHHTGAMFDRSKTVTLVGTVKDFLYSNPHCWIQMLVPTENGKAEEWDIQASAPTRLKGWGLTPETLKKGDKITLTTHPLRDGRKGGSLVTVKLPNGTLVDTGDNTAPLDAEGITAQKGGASADGVAPATDVAGTDTSGDSATENNYPEPDDGSNGTTTIVVLLIAIVLILGAFFLIARRVGWIGKGPSRAEQQKAK